jgi:hypothetical protein
MDVKVAVSTAKEQVKELFSADNVSNVTLEEINFAESDEVWEITVGITRPSAIPRNNSLAALVTPEFERAYKVVRIRDSDQRILSVTNRVAQAA